jgi:tetratricopeptide (TPR) repeat protein
VPPDGGGWRELRTDHFVLRTDLPSGRARGLLAEPEAVVDGLHKGLFGERPKELSLAVDVVAFESKRDVDLFLPAKAEAATSLDARSSRPEKLVLAERATREHPADARAWLLLATAVTEPARTEAALRRAVDVDPLNAAARNALARYLLQSGKALDALPHANEAVRLAPWSPSSIDTLAAVAQALGRCPEALRLQRRAVENIRESDRAGQLKRYLDRLVSLEQSCGAPGAGASH